jgi:osmotically-inducible protein OsmY
MTKNTLFLKAGLFGIIFSFGLSACVPVVLVTAGATAGGAIVYDKRSLKTMAEDRDTVSKLLKQINDDPQLKSQTHITVSMFNDIMLLTGQAQTEELRNRTYQIASGMPNVKLIYNEIAIGAPTSTSTQTHDTWITTKVKSAMLAEKGLRSTQIKVVTENSAVYLMGVTTHKQADLAADVASKGEGVTKVVKIFEYE